MLKTIYAEGYKKLHNFAPKSCINSKYRHFYESGKMWEIFIVVDNSFIVEESVDLFTTLFFTFRRREINSENQKIIDQKNDQNDSYRRVANVL